MIVREVQNFLNKNKVKYKIIALSPAYSQREISDYKASLGMELIEAVLIEIDRRQLAMVIVSASLTVHLGSLQKALGTADVKLLDRQRFRDLFPGCELGTIPPFGHLFEMEVFLSQDLFRHREITFYVGSYSHLFRMKLIDYEALLKSRRKLSFLTRSRYRALVSNVTPNASRPHLYDSDRCFLGVSLGSNAFSTPKLVAIADWIGNHYKRCTVFIADSIYRLTLQITQDYSEQQAINRALLLGKEFIERAAIVFERHTERCQFDLIFASELEKTQDYLQYLQQFQDLFIRDSIFANSVKSCQDVFIYRHFDPDADRIDRYADISRDYLLEELALTACLAKHGLNVMIYPGDLAAIFGDISSGTILNVPECLKQIAHASLHLKKR